MTGRAGRAAGALLLAAVLAGCGGQGGAGVGSSAGAGASEPAAGQPAVPTPLPVADELPEPLPGPSGRPRGSARTITGTVVAGVEEGCLLLSTQAGDHLLLGGDPAVVRPGARLVVTGRPDPSVLTTCQQGAPFRVTSARPA